MIEQAVQATFGSYGSWNHLSVLIVGQNLQEEGEYFLSKGCKEDNINLCGFEEVKGRLESDHFDILILRFPKEVPFTGAYSEVITSMQQLRDTTQRPRVLLLETSILGFEGDVDYGDPELTLKQIYLEVLSSLEEKLADQYIPFHEKLLDSVREEDYEKRLAWLFDQDETQKAVDSSEELKELFFLAQLRVLVEQHASRTFQAGFIAGGEKERESLFGILKPSLPLAKFMGKFPTNAEDLLTTRKVSDRQIDPDRPEVECQSWDEMETVSGKFLDFHCKKTFNRLSRQEKFQLTGDIQFDQQEEKDSNSTPDITHNFRKFEVSDNPLGSLMGGGGAMMGGLNLGGSSAPTPSLSQESSISLEEHGEALLALLASYQRKKVFVGGTLFEYRYDDSDGLVLGSILTLSQDEKLTGKVDAFAKALDLPKLKKTDPKSALKAFFDFNRDYIKYYDKIRAQVKVSFDTHLGSLTKEDYELERERELSLESSVQVDMKARKEREKRLAKLSKSSMKARQEVLKKLKDKKSLTSGSAKSDDQDDLEVATIELSLSEEEMNQLNSSLQSKRKELEEKIAIDEERRVELEEAILKEQEVRETKRKEIELQRKKKAEAEKADLARRQQRLAEERKKREEVKKMRAKNLREAFDRAREAALRKQESKGEKDETTKDKKPEKKKYNPEAVKMMIRFGTDDKKIMNSTGISDEDLEELKGLVSQEDANL